MNETEFHRLADDTLNRLADRLEDADQSGALEVEYEAGALAVNLPSGKQVLVTKHTPTAQLWLASAWQGGLHFVWNPDTAQWALADGRTLNAVLQEELRRVNVTVDL